jgi:hypothetical protein
VTHPKKVILFPAPVLALGIRDAWRVPGKREKMTKPNGILVPMG